MISLLSGTNNNKLLRVWLPHLKIPRQLINNYTFFSVSSRWFLHLDLKLNKKRTVLKKFLIKDLKLDFFYIFTQEKLKYLVFFFLKKNQSHDTNEQKKKYCTQSYLSLWTICTLCFNEFCFAENLFYNKIF